MAIYKACCAPKFSPADLWLRLRFCDSSCKRVSDCTLSTKSAFCIVISKLKTFFLTSRTMYVSVTSDLLVKAQYKHLLKKQKTRQELKTHSRSRTHPRLALRFTWRQNLSTRRLVSLTRPRVMYGLQASSCTSCAHFANRSRVKTSQNFTKASPMTRSQIF